MLSKKSKLCLALSLTTALVALQPAEGFASAEEGFGSEIIDAADSNSYEAVLSVLQAGADANEVGEFGTSALMRSASHGNAEIAALLLKSGGNPNTADIGGATPLHIAARTGNAEVVSLLIAAEADVNAADNEGNTPLMIASMNDYADIAKTLVAAGANSNASNQSGETALLFATQNLATNAADVLVKNGADADVVDTEGFSIAEVAERTSNQLLVAKLDAANPDHVMISMGAGFQSQSAKQKEQTQLAQSDIVEEFDPFARFKSNKELKHEAAREDGKQLLAQLADVEAIDFAEAEYNDPDIDLLATPRFSQNEKSHQLAQLEPAAKNAGKKTWLAGVTEAFEEVGAFELASVKSYAEGATYSLLELGSFKNKGFADQRVAELQSKHGQIFDKVSLVVFQNGSGDNVEYVVKGGILNNKAEADGYCKSLVAQGVRCSAVESALITDEQFQKFNPNAKSAFSAPTVEKAEIVEVPEQKAIKNIIKLEDDVDSELKAAAEKNGLPPLPKAPEILAPKTLAVLAPKPASPVLDAPAPAKAAAPVAAKSAPQKSVVQAAKTEVRHSAAPKPAAPVAMPKATPELVVAAPSLPSIPTSPFARVLAPVVAEVEKAVADAPKPAQAPAQVLVAAPVVTPAPATMPVTKIAEAPAPRVLASPPKNLAATPNTVQFVEPQEISVDEEKSLTELAGMADETTDSSEPSDAVGSLIDSIYAEKAEAEKTVVKKVEPAQKIEVKPEIKLAEKQDLAVKQKIEQLPPISKVTTLDNSAQVQKREITKVVFAEPKPVENPALIRSSELVEKAAVVAPAAAAKPTANAEDDSFSPYRSAPKAVAAAPAALSAMPKPIVVAERPVFAAQPQPQPMPQPVPDKFVVAKPIAVLPSAPVAAAAPKVVAEAPAAVAALPVYSPPAAKALFNAQPFAPKSFNRRENQNWARIDYFTTPEFANGFYWKYRQNGTLGEGIKFKATKDLINGVNYSALIGKFASSADANAFCAKIYEVEKIRCTVQSVLDYDYKSAFNQPKNGLNRHSSR